MSAKIDILGKSSSLYLESGNVHDGIPQSISRKHFKFHLLEALHFKTFMYQTKKDIYSSMVLLKSAPSHISYMEYRRISSSLKLVANYQCDVKGIGCEILKDLFGREANEFVFHFRQAYFPFFPTQAKTFLFFSQPKFPYFFETKKFGLF